ncbi:MAG: hypothetical protein VB013_07415 [Anaerolineaceae bacterium]|nr:hypothetical protein [Anaerolineaceae bacterium]
MKNRGAFFLFAFSLAFYIGVSLLQKTPGYMDASYYFATGTQIATGQTNEPFLWNYLNSPETAKAPIFSYWMPLAGLLAAIPMAICGIHSFQVARVLFIILAALIPVFCFLFVKKFTENKVIHWMAAAFGLLGGYYLPYLTLTETFTPFFVLGGIFFWLTFDLVKRDTANPYWKWLLLGGIAGLMHLCRADGILWLGGAFLVCLVGTDWRKWRVGQLFSKFGLVALGYLLILAGWFLRNILVYHALFPIGSNLTLWMTEYNDLFVYPASILTPDRWVASGIQALLSVRSEALLTNLQSVVGIIGGIVLFPFLVAGLWKLRHEKVVQFALFMFLLLLILMSFVFPFAGSRGGFFHSVSAFQILFWAISAYGFEVSIRWIAAKRKWQVKKSIPLLGSTLVLVFAIISSLTLYIKIAGLTDLSTGWDRPFANYQRVDAFLRQETGDAGSRVMVNDSPGYFVATGRETIQEANADIATLGDMFSKYELKYLLIGKDHLPSLDELYQTTETFGKFKFIGKEGEYVIYAFLQ